ncbi:fused response regulator/phosphatase [Paenibacillus psychroresistens]|uniref:Fused response regulator/phosphatase n=1 Tax=Paenibacillus psychroresistens TaxID=1778678 RepID=A0A6B8RTX9_9BACL|nr:fused response regulator/phosphatase [Paenibacillus psychroresistens]QGQ98638.1 fused response regulator/phosphatase [Paenibacillus psychroresistens]
MSIIIVDDNLTNQLIIVRILENAGYKDLLTASSAQELFIHLKMDTSNTQELPVDLILLDMMMPAIDGVEACRRIQDQSHLRDIPIVFVTAMGDSNKMAEALDAGAIDYVMKPINKIELLARIRSALRLKYEKNWHKERDKHINSELELAKQVQGSVLSQPIDDENVKIDAFYQPSFELAGDFYAWYRISEHRYGIILLDMMGHGISSSLVCMFISSVLQDTIKKITDPEQVISELNRYMNRLNMPDKLVNYYFTAIYLVLDTEEKTIEYVNAGHPPGLVFMDDQVVQLEQSSCAVGFFEKINISKGKLKYTGSLQIVLYTDGLMEFVQEDRDSNLELEVFTAQLKNYKDLAFADLAANFDLRDNEVIQEDDICLVRISTK